MTDFDFWVKACEENRTKIWCLAGFRGDGLYSTWNEYECRNDYFRKTQIYHVWIGGRRIYCGMSYTAAYEAWRKENHAAESGR